MNSNFFFSQFVPFRDYIDRTGNHILSMARLAKDVLAEIPDQFLSYMRTRGIKPSPAPPPYTPPGQPLQTQIWGGENVDLGVEFHREKTLIPLKQLYMPCYLGARWRFSCSGTCVSARRVTLFSTGQTNESLLPLSSIPLSIWTFLFYIFLPGKLETVWRVKIKLRTKGKSWSWRKERWRTTFTLEEGCLQTEQRKLDFKLTFL